MMKRDVKGRRGSEKVKLKGSWRKGGQGKEKEGGGRDWQGRKGVIGGKEGDSFVCPVTPGPLSPHNSMKNLVKKRSHKKANIGKGT